MDYTIIRSIDTIIRMLGVDYIENTDIEEKIQGVCIDSKKAVKGNLYIPIHGANSSGHAYVQQTIDNGTRAVLWERREASPPKEIVVTLVDDTTAALQQLVKAYCDQPSIKVVGVTDSSGKTSMKGILASVLVKHFITRKILGNHNNEIGVPLTLLSLSESCEAAVVGMRMENLQELSFLIQIVRSDIATISNIDTAYLENLGIMENTARAKMETTERLEEHGLLIYNGDQQFLRNTAIEKQIPGYTKIRTFGGDEQNDVVVYQVRQLPDGPCFSIRDQVYYLDMTGEHRTVNATATWIVARALGLDEGEVAQSLANIEKARLRNKLVRVNQYLILNDSYKSNPQSTLAAVDTMEEFDIPYKLAALGDTLEPGETSGVIHYTPSRDINNYHLQEVLTIGDMVCYIAQGVRDDTEHTLVRHFTDKEELLNYLRSYTYEGCMPLMKGNHGMKPDEVVDELVKEQQWGVHIYGRDKTSNYIRRKIKWIPGAPAFCGKSDPQSQ